MNETGIEKFLFQAPKPTVPGDLLKELQTQIALSPARPAPNAPSWQIPLRRWFPAMAFSMLMLSCAVAIAVQASWNANLKRENATLRASVADLPQLREKHAAWEQAQANHDELAQLRRDNEELHSLQAEAAQLRKLPARVEQLQNENKRLAEMVVRSSSTNANNVLDALADAKARAERIQCVNNLKQIGLAFRIWAGDNGDRYPTSLIVMSNLLSTTKILICPSDSARQPYASLGFGSFQDSMTSYQLTVQPDDGSLKFPQCIIAKCPIHSNYLLADGSVQQINLKNPAYHEVNVDGHWYLKSINDPDFHERTVAPAP